MISAALLILAMTPGASDAILKDGFDAYACPNGRQTQANISWSGFTVTNVDVRQWANVWGHSTAFDPPVPWPGRPDSMPIILNFDKTTYMALQFPVPTDSQSNLYGWLTHTEYNYGQDLTAAISTECGDFNPVPACYVEAISGMNIVPWSVHTPITFCPMTPGQNYFLNIRITDPNRPSTTCAPASPSCAIGTANNVHLP